MELRGKYGSAIVYTDEIEETAIAQIINLLNQPMAEGAHLRIMPDVHAGSGCVIGYTAKLTDKIIPNLIGVDIGCGVMSWNLGRQSIDFQKFDNFIRKTIPSGKNIRDDIFDFSVIPGVPKMDANIEKDILDVAKRLKLKDDRFLPSIGTLGGGNHFMEIDKDDNGDYWFTVHTGSRNFGLQIANAHQAIAKSKNHTGITPGLEYLEGKDAEQYFWDMQTAQMYASLNRRVIGYQVLTKYFKLPYLATQWVESVHNYIDFQKGFVRKGAISAQNGENVIIPMSMADGIVIGVGKGNDEWNCSAPHGAGRHLSRGKAKETLDLEHFKKVMRDRHVWSSCVSKDTLDESPMAYKNAEKVIEYLKDSVEVTCRMKPVYNFKASE